MKDEHRRLVYKKLGWMADIKCECCNWTLRGPRNQNKRAINKQVRAHLKQDLRRIINE